MQYLLQILAPCHARSLSLTLYILCILVLLGFRMLFTVIFLYVQNEFGVWEIFLPNNADGSPAIPHGSRVKVCILTMVYKLCKENNSVFSL